MTANYHAELISSWTF